MLIWSALQDIAARPGVALRLCIVPFVLLLAAETNYSYHFIRTEYTGDHIAAIISVLTSFLCVGWIAVGWHRARLLDEPAGIVPSFPIPLLLRYAIDWFVLGLVIIMMLLLAIGVIYVISLVLPFDLFGSALAYGVEDDPLSGPIFLLPVVAFVWHLFRYGTHLPNIAVEQVEHMGMRDSWVRSKPLAWPIFWAAVIAGGLEWLALYLPTELLYNSELLLPEAGGFDWLEVFVIVFYALHYTISPLIGAAILTVIYARTAK